MRRMRSLLLAIVGIALAVAWGTAQAAGPCAEGGMGTGTVPNDNIHGGMGTGTVPNDDIHRGMGTGTMPNDDIHRGLGTGTMDEYDTGQGLGTGTAPREDVEEPMSGSGTESVTPVPGAGSAPPERELGTGTVRDDVDNVSPQISPGSPGAGPVPDNGIGTGEMPSDLQPPRNDNGSFYNVPDPRPNVTGQGGLRRQGVDTGN